MHETTSKSNHLKERWVMALAALRALIVYAVEGAIIDVVVAILLDFLAQVDAWTQTRFECCTRERLAIFFHAVNEPCKHVEGILRRVCRHHQHRHQDHHYHYCPLATQNTNNMTRSRLIRRRDSKSLRMFSNEDVTVGSWMLAMDVNHEDNRAICDPRCTPTSIAVPRCSVTSSNCLELLEGDEIFVIGVPM
ncbi:putative beta-1,3-galactosyltransferase 12 [Acorus calamus]|uniref:Beta-1,3-galactosyltransferase 12 n=1 Tax=Acorus calamus TaxID=4465 RepID=A0AAV9E3K3_ACOCL|nr:putative beta-1,3-galactosyltransferase 12 [Acorus calamus]